MRSDFNLTIFARIAAVTLIFVVCPGLLAGCAVVKGTGDALFGPEDQASGLAERMSTYRDIRSLPAPRGKIRAAVYSFRDQTGQYKPSPASSFSTAVTQGAGAMLMQVMSESGWFIPLEREGLQNLLTERKIIRAAEKQRLDVGGLDSDLPSLMSANIMLEGGVVAYDTNVQTGGAGIRYFGIGVDEQYRVDQVTVNLRAVDVRTGSVLASVLTSKKILSRKVQGDVFRYVEFKRLLEIEAGTTSNDPAQLCVLSAIESAVIHLIAQGVQGNLWSVRDEAALAGSVLQQYAETPVKIVQ